MYYSGFSRDVGRHVCDISVQNDTESGTRSQEIVNGVVSVLKWINYTNIL